MLNLYITEADVVVPAATGGLGATTSRRLTVVAAATMATARSLTVKECRRLRDHGPKGGGRKVNVIPIGVAAADITRAMILLSDFAD